MKPKFGLVSNVPVPVERRIGGRNSTFPFNAMEVGQSFFIPNYIDDAGKTVEASKKYASTVSSAMVRFAEPVPGEFREKKTFIGYDAAGAKMYKSEQVPKIEPTRVFIIRAALGDGWGFEGVKGAGVWRTK